MNASSKIEFYDYTIGPKNHLGLIPVIRLGTDVSLEVKEDVLIAIKSFTIGCTLEKASELSGIKVSELESIISSLKEDGLVKSIDNAAVQDPAKLLKPWIPDIPNSYFSWFTSKAMIIITSIVIAIGLVTWIMNPEYYISYEKFFWTKDIFLVFLSLYAVSFILVFMHELMHFLATRAVGGQAKMSLSTRYIFLVAETDSYYLPVIPKKKRYLVYLSGMYFDLFVASIAILALEYFQLTHAPVNVYHRLLLMLIMAETLRILWEFNIFLETDVYNFMSDFLDEENLMEDAKKEFIIRLKKTHIRLIKPWVKKIKSLIINEEELEDSDDLRLLNRKDHRLVNIYTAIVGIGLIITTFNFALIIAPREINLLLKGIEQFSMAISSGDRLSILKACLFIFLFCIQYILILIIVFDRKAKRIPVH